MLFLEPGDYLKRLVGHRILETLYLGCFFYHQWGEKTRRCGQVQSITLSCDHNSLLYQLILVGLQLKINEKWKHGPIRFKKTIIIFIIIYLHAAANCTRISLHIIIGQKGFADLWWNLCWFLRFTVSYLANWC